MNIFMALFAPYIPSYVFSKPYCLLQSRLILPTLQPEVTYDLLV